MGRGNAKTEKNLCRAVQEHAAGKCVSSANDEAGLGFCFPNLKVGKISEDIQRRRTRKTPGTCYGSVHAYLLTISILAHYEYRRVIASGGLGS